MGHGHVTPNPDGSKARCGGPTICEVCRRELAVHEFQMNPPEGRLGDQPVDPQLHQMMVALIHAIDNTLNGPVRPKKVGFVLMTFPYGKAGRCNYMSNGASRKDIAILLREQLQQFEGPSGAR